MSVAIQGSFSFAFLLIGCLCAQQIVPLTQDAFIVPGNAANFGSAPTVAVGGPAGAEGLIEFDLSALPAGTSGDQVINATLTLFVDRVAAGGTISVSTANGAWTEFSANGVGIYPGIGQAIVPAVQVTLSNSYLLLDVTSAVRQWLSGISDNGFIITPNSSGVAIQLDSKENSATSHPARLEITLSGRQGATGPSGVSGAAGPVGPPGPTGISGLAGPVGSAGPRGAPGPQGPQGRTGAQGPVGANATSFAVCISGATNSYPASCGCSNALKVQPVSGGNFCSVLSGSGGCSAVSTLSGGVGGAPATIGACCVCQ